MAAPNSSAGWLERLFKLSDNKTTFRTEVLAGVTTFLTMCSLYTTNFTEPLSYQGSAF
ncbi:hypothetical protein RFG25_18475, partial [Acinetobacter baumannii]|nr:hypothetical protein [Acinetobacter baumannii]